MSHLLNKIQALQTCFRCSALFLVKAPHGHLSANLGRPVPAPWVVRIAEDRRAASALISASLISLWQCGHSIFFSLSMDRAQTGGVRWVQSLSCTPASSPQ